MRSTYSFSVLAAAVPALAQGMGPDAGMGGGAPGGMMGGGGPGGGLGSLQDWMPPPGYPPEAQPKFTSVRSVMASAMPPSVKQEFATATQPPIVETMAWFSSLPDDVRQYVSSMDGALASIGGGSAPPAAAATDSSSNANAKTTGLAAGAGTATASSGAGATGSSKDTKTTKAASSSATASSKNATQTKNAGLVAATPLGGSIGGIIVGIVGAFIGAAALV